MNLDKLAGYSLQVLFGLVIYLLLLWFLGVGLASGIVLLNRFDLLIDQEVIGMVVVFNTLLIPLTIASYLSLKSYYKKVKNNK